MLGRYYKKIIAFLMLFLIVSLTPAMALNYNIHGSMNQENVVAANEQFQAEIDNPGFQVLINNSDSLTPCPCTSSFSECRCFFSAQSSPGNKIINGVVNNSGSLDIFSMNYFLDAVAPTINTTSSLEGNILTVNYTVIDTTGSDEKPCTGIYNVDIFVNNHLEHSQIFNSNNCNITNKVDIEIENPDPLLITSLRVKDMAGNTNEQEVDSQEMDVLPPVVVGSFDIYQGENIFDKIALGIQEIPIVDVVFYVDEQKLNPNGVYGDLSDFNNIPIQNLGYNHKQALCTRGTGETLYKCSFKNIKFHPNSANIELPVVLIDEQNNRNNLTLKRNYQIISPDNQVIHIGPAKGTSCDIQGNCYVGSNALIQVEITGVDQTRFEQMHVPLRTSQLSNFDHTNPYDCGEKEGKWLCYYSFPVDASDGEIKWVYIDSTASDDYGKSLSGLTKGKVEVDKLPPQIINNSIKVLVNNKEVQDYCLTPTDTLSFELEAVDSRSPELIIQANTQTSITNVYKDKCEKSNDRFICKVDISNFINAGVNDSKIHFQVFDLAGNNDKYALPINLCVADIETIPNLVKSISVQSSKTPLVDRSVASYHYWKTFADLKFILDSSSQGDVRLIDFEITNCEAYDEDAGADYVYGSGSDSYYFFNKYAESGQSAILIGGQDILADDVDLVCQVAFTGRIGNTFYRRPQVKNFTLTLNFEGINLNSPDENVIKEIDKIKEDLRDLDKDLGWRKGLDVVLGNLCKAAKGIYTANAVIQAADLSLKILSYALPFLKGASEAFHKIAEPILSTTTRFVWPPGNIYSNIISGTLWNRPSLGIYIKTVCFVYTCKFYDFQEVTNFVASKFIFNKKKKEPVKKPSKPLLDPEKRYNPYDYTNPGNEPGEDSEGGRYPPFPSTPLSQEELDKLPQTPEPGLPTTTETPQENPVTQPATQPETADTPEPSSNPIADSLDPLMAGYQLEEGINSINNVNNEEVLQNTNENINHYVLSSQVMEENDEGGNYWNLGNRIQNIIEVSNINTNTEGYDFNSPFDTFTTDDWTNPGGNAIAQPNIVGKAAQEYDPNFLTNQWASPNPTDLWFSPPSSNTNNPPSNDGTSSPNPKDTSWNDGDYQGVAENFVKSSILKTDSWVINPYKSEAYDDLCFPATLFNLEKKKELKCLYIKCLQQAKKGAFSKELCSQVYDYRTCLYIESAQVRLTGASWETFWKSFRKAAGAAVLSTAVSIGFQKLCSKYYKPVGAMGEDDPYEGGFKSWLCGGLIIYMKVNEIVANSKALYSTFQHEDLGNNCEGVEYEE